MSGEDARQSFLLAAARRALDSSAAPDLATALDAGDWELLFNLADAHRVTPLLCAAAAALPAGGIPDAARRSLDEQHLALVVTHLAAVSDLRRALGSLSEHGVNAALAAAPDAVLAVSGVAGWGLIKVTLLVAPQNCETARAILVADGCRELAPATGASARIELVGSAGTRFVVEREVAALERSCTVVLAGQPVAALAPEDRFLALCARAMPKQWARLDYLVAVAALSRDMTDPGDLLQRARRVGLDGAVLTGVALAHDVLGVETALTPMALRDRPARIRARDARAALANPPSAPGVAVQLSAPVASASTATGTAPRKLVLRQFQSPGDLVMLTAAVRDLHLQYPGRFVTDVRTPCPDLWLNNPYIAPLNDADAGVEVIHCEYPLIHHSNQAPYHFIHGFIEYLNDRLGLQIKPSAFKGDIHLSDDERRGPSAIRGLTGSDLPFWIVSAGGKLDFTIKWWSHARYQALVERFRGRLLFVQVGERGHHHPPLSGAIDLRGRTSLRDLIRLVYHTDGVLGPVSLLMHLAAAVPSRNGLRHRPSVVIAGGREPSHWEAYPGHQFLHTVGTLPCCESGGCWRSRTLPIGDRDEKDDPQKLCVDVVDGLPRCMDAVTVDDAARAVERYLCGGLAPVLTPEQNAVALRVITGEPQEEPASPAGVPLPIRYRACRPAQRGRPPAVTVCVMASGDRLAPLRQCIESIRRSCPRDAAALAVGATAISAEVREYLYSLRLEGVVDRLHESPVAIDAHAMRQRVLADVTTEFVWWFDDELQAVTADLFERGLAEVDAPQDAAAPRTGAAAERPLFARAEDLRRPADVRPPDVQESRPSASLNAAFVTVTDYAFFPGTVATVNSILEFHPEATIYVVTNEKRPLSDPQREYLAWARVRVISSALLERPGRYVNAWELKAYACADLCEGHDVVVGIDSDCLLCAPVHDEIARAFQSGSFLGGRDGNGATYDEPYRAYGIETPAHNPTYMSTSLFFVAVTDENRRVLARWAECCSRAEFNRTGPCPGHGDQGVLNAVLFAENRSRSVELLPNELWSQHWAFWSAAIDFNGGSFRNVSAGSRRQRAFHCGGVEKFWAPDHRERVLNGNGLQAYPYIWYLAMLWLGPCRRWDVDPHQYLPPASHHLLDDLVLFLPQIFQVYPAARGRWDGLTDAMIDRLLNGIPRALSLGGGSMTEVIEIVAARPWIRRYVEVGSYEGGSILTAGLRFLNRDIDFFSIESFMGNKDGRMDGHQLPSRERFLANLARFPALRVKLVPGESPLPATMFGDGTVDMVFIDGCHETAAVVADIDAWLPKLAHRAIVAGDDYGWESVRKAVDEKFDSVNVTPSGNVWWKELQPRG